MEDLRLTIDSFLKPHITQPQSEKKVLGIDNENGCFSTCIFKSDTVDMKTGIITVETSHEMCCVDFDDVLSRKFLVSGGFDDINGEEYYKACIEDNGGIITNDLSNDIDYLISNDISMIHNAKERHITVLTESEFLKNSTCWSFHLRALIYMTKYIEVC